MKSSFFLRPFWLKFVLGLSFFYLIQISQLDDFIWTENGRIFLEALKQGDLAKTYIGPDLFHPGISVIWISAIVNLCFGWMSMDYLIVVQRAAFIAVFSLLTYLSFKLWIKRWPTKVFFLTLLYLLCNPFSLLWGTITWLDSLLLSLTLPIVLYWISFLETRKSRYLVITGILIGLSVLTKYIGADRLGMIIGITIWYCFQQKENLKKFISPLIKVSLIAFLTFALLYPAFWLDPIFVVFDRYNTSRSYQEISYAHIVSRAEIYLKYIPKIDLLIFLGSIITFYQILKKRTGSFIYTSIGGLIHLAVLLIALLLLNDIRRGSEAFLGSIGRYQITSIWLLAPIYFDCILKLKLPKWLMLSAIGIPFLIELFFVFSLSFYPWIY